MAEFRDTESGFDAIQDSPAVGLYQSLAFASRVRLIVKRICCYMKIKKCRNKMP